MSDNVVFAEFRSKETVGEGFEFVACQNCRNKTFVLVYEGIDKRALMKCAACGNHIGHVGFLP